MNACHVMNGGFAWTLELLRIISGLLRLDCNTVPKREIAARGWDHSGDACDYLRWLWPCNLRAFGILVSFSMLVTLRYEIAYCTELMTHEITAQNS